MDDFNTIYNTRQNDQELQELLAWAQEGAARVDPKNAAKAANDTGLTPVSDTTTKVPNPFNTQSTVGIAPTPSALGKPTATDPEIMAMLRGEKPEDNPAKSWLHAFGEVAEGPIHGSIKAFTETYTTLKSAENWLLWDRIYPETPKLDAKGTPMLDASGNPIMWRGETYERLHKPETLTSEIPNFPEPTSLGGTLSSGISQFVAATVGLGKLGMFKNVAGYKGFIGQGALADIIAFDAHQENFANLVRAIPALDTPLTQYLSADPEDSMALGKLKNALTNVVPNSMLYGVVEAIKYGATRMREFKAKQPEVEKRQTQAQIDVQKIAELDEKDKQLALLGDPSRNAWEFFEQPTVKAAEKQGETVSGVIARKPGAEAEPRITEDGTPITGPLEDVKIDPMLSGARPTFAGEGRKFSLNFQDPLDKLAYLYSTGHNLGVRALRQLKDAGWNEDDITRIAEAVANEVEGQAKALPLGAKPAITVEPTGARLFGAAPPSEAPQLSSPGAHQISYGEGKGYATVNWAAINNMDDVLSTVKQITEELGRNPQLKTWMQARQNRSGINAVDEVLFADRSKAPMDDEMLAVKELLASSYEKGYKLAQMLTTSAAQGNDTTSLGFAFAKMYEANRLVANYYDWAGTGVGRSLNIRKAPTPMLGGVLDAASVKDIDKALGTLDGVQNIQTVAQIFINAVDRGLGESGAAALKDFNQKDWIHKTNDTVFAMWVNSVLSSTKSLVINVANPLVLTLQQATERGMMEGIAKVTGDTSGVVPGQTAQWLYGMLEGIPDALSYAKSAFLTGGKGRAWGDMYAATTTDIKQLPNRPNPLSSKFWGMKTGSPATKALADAVDTAGTVMNWPTRANLAGDEFWSTLFFRGELRAQAYRQAQQEIASGALQPEALSNRVANLMKEQPDALFEKAKADAAYNTLTNDPGAVGKALGAIADLGFEFTGPLGRYLVPFHTIPANVFNYANQRMPYQLLNRANREAIMKGGEEGQRELAKMFTGGLALGIGTNLYQRGFLTGRGSIDPQEAQALRREGVQPYSVRIGDTWYNINRLDNFGYLLGLVADMGDYYSFLHDQDEDTYKGLANASYTMALGVMNSVMSKSYLQGLMNLDKAVQDPRTYGQQFIYNQVSTFVPFSGLGNNVNQLIDPNLQQAGSLLQAWGSKIPGIGLTGIPRVDLFGRTMTVSRGTSQIWNALMPIEMSAHNPDPIDEELVKQKLFFKMPDKKFAIGPNEIDMHTRPDVYARYNQLAGNELVDPAYGKGCKDFLNDVVSGNSLMSEEYKQLSGDGGTESEKGMFIRNVILGYRKQAQEQIMAEYPELIHPTKKAKIYNVAVQ